MSHGLAWCPSCPEPTQAMWHQCNLPGNTCTTIPRNANSIHGNSTQHVTHGVTSWRWCHLCDVSSLSLWCERSQSPPSPNAGVQRRDARVSQAGGSRWCMANAGSHLLPTTGLITTTPGNPANPGEMFARNKWKKSQEPLHQGCKWSYPTPTNTHCSGMPFWAEERDIKNGVLAKGELGELDTWVSPWKWLEWP